jgi:pimeloyl-ACP methyl ester carboxylesterase
MSATTPQPALGGNNVICLHSSMSTSRQWRGLVERLRHSYRVDAIDLHGYGDGPAYSGVSPLSLQREVSLLAQLVEELDGPIHLVGHSYGGAVAIKAAQTFGRRINSLTLYEPVIFAALFSSMPTPAAASEVTLLIEKMQTDYRAGGLFRAAQRFIDYWSGPGAWEAMPFDTQLRLSKKVPVVLGNFEALVSEPDALAGLARLQIPTLYLSGSESPASVRAISDLLQRELPHAVRQRFDGMGHMGPITHGDTVNASIETFINHRAAMNHPGPYARAA